jgi:hypothetical protein
VTRTPLTLLELATVLLLVAVYLVPMWRIAGKMGYPGALSILACMPGINIVVAWVLAFRKWPIEREMERLRGRS